MTFRRTARFLGGVALVCVVLALAPVAAIEGGCRGGSPANAPAIPLVADAGYSRPETNSYLSFPEWYIVYAYQDLAGILRDHDEGAFRYVPSIAGYWTSFCDLNRVASQHGAVARDEKVMLYVIGLSFTAEMAIKGAYETTIGAAFAWLRGPVLTPEDRFIHRMQSDYAAFLRQVPWYEYGFATKLGELLFDLPFGGGLRSIERRVALAMEWGGKALYAQAIAALAGLAPAEERIGSVVSGPDVADVAKDPRIRVVRALPGGALLIDTPRYAAFTEIVAGLAARGLRIDEIAGNRAVLVTALRRDGDTAPLPGAREIFSIPVQSRPGWRRVGLDAAVPELAALVRTLAERGADFEHVYDY